MGSENCHRDTEEKESQQHRAFRNTEAHGLRLREVKASQNGFVAQAKPMESEKNGDLQQNYDKKLSENGHQKSGIVSNGFHVPRDSKEDGEKAVENSSKEEAKNTNGSKPVPYMEKPPDGMKCLGINGYWYNISQFINKHPGGPVIEEFVGYDATDAYRSFHKQDVLKQRHFRPIGHYKKNWLEFNKAMHKLHQDLLEEGFYKVNYYWYAMKISLTFVYISAVFALVINFSHSWVVLTLAAVLLAFFWQQNGFLMHDFMHSQVTQNKAIDEVLGTWTGTVCIG